MAAEPPLEQVGASVTSGKSVDIEHEYREILFVRDRQTLRCLQRRYPVQGRQAT